MDQTSTITVTRPWALTGSARKFRVLCDGTEVARIAVNSSVTFSVSPGPHAILVKVDWLAGKPFQVNVVPGEQLDLVSASADDYLQSLLASLCLANTYLQLRPRSSADDQPKSPIPFARIGIYCAIWFAVVMVLSVGAMIVITNSGSSEAIEEARSATAGLVAGVSLVIGWVVIAVLALTGRIGSK